MKKQPANDIDSVINKINKKNNAIEAKISGDEIHIKINAPTIQRSEVSHLTSTFNSILEFRGEYALVLDLSDHSVPGSGMFGALLKMREKYGNLFILASNGITDLDWFKLYCTKHVTEDEENSNETNDTGLYVMNDEPSHVPSFDDLEDE